VTNSTVWLPVLIAGAAAIVVAVIGASMTDLGPWYSNLNKPEWQPPDWAFGPAWTLIFALAALAGVMAWNDAPDEASREWVIGLFALNGVLNILWSALFFRLHRPDWALVEVVFLWLSILLVTMNFARYSRRASVTLFPYLAWVTFAGILNYEVARLNGFWVPF
jgi:translocator protein